MATAGSGRAGMGLALVEPAGRAEGSEMKMPRIPSIFRRVEGRGAKGGEKMARSEGPARRRWVSSGVIIGSLFASQLRHTSSFIYNIHTSPPWFSDTTLPQSHHS